MENNNDFEDNEHKDIEIVTGDGNLNISPVYDHIDAEKPRPKDNRTVVIPEVKKEISRQWGQLKSPGLAEGFLD